MPAGAVGIDDRLVLLDAAAVADARAYDTLIVALARGDTTEEHSLEVSMPIGAFVDSQVTPTCGLAGSEGIIGLFDDPTSFFEPERVNAQLLWFHHGYVEYRFPNRLPSQATVASVAVSLELCSEAPLHHKEWPSDVTMRSPVRQLSAGHCAASALSIGAATPDESRHREATRPRYCPAAAPILPTAQLRLPFTLAMLFL